MANKVLTTVVRMIFLVCIIIPVILCTIGFFSIGKLFGSIILVLSTVLVFVFVWAVSKSKTGSEKILITVIAIGIAIRLFYSLFIDKEPLSDQLVCYNAAQALLKGDLSWAKNEYFVHYPFQIPFILYESLILRIFGSIRALYAFNGLFSIATCFLVYLIAKTLTNRHAALISTAIYALLPSSIFMIHWLYNYTIFGVFFLLSILFFIKFCKAQFLAKITFKCILNCVLTGLFLSISNLFRGEGIIGILAALVWFLYAFASGVTKNNIKPLLLKTILCVLSLILTYYLIYYSVDIIVMHTISPLGIKNPCIYWMIVCGLTPENYGAYSTKYNYILNYTDKQEQLIVFKNILHDIFDNMSFGEVIKFICMKLYYFWGVMDKGCATFSDGANVPTSIVLGIGCLNHLLYYLLLLLSAYSFKKRLADHITIFLMILFIGYFSVHIIREIKIPYLYSSLLVLTLLSSVGINGIIDDQPLKKISSLKVKRLKKR